MPAQLLSLEEGPHILLDKPILLIGRHEECDLHGQGDAGGAGADAVGPKVIHRGDAEDAENRREACIPPRTSAPSAPPR